MFTELKKSLQCTFQTNLVNLWLPTICFVNYSLTTEEILMKPFIFENIKLVSSSSPKRKGSCDPVALFWHRHKQRDDSDFVNSPWVQHSTSHLLLEGDFSASRCLPAGYASLLRNTSVSHTSCGQAHRSVLSERDSEGGAGGGKQTENRGQCCFMCSPAGAQTH